MSEPEEIPRDVGDRHNVVSKVVNVETMLAQRLYIKDIFWGSKLSHPPL
jgi:hypothetical protein